jgi:hypothetical protein
MALRIVKKLEIFFLYNLRGGYFASAGDGVSYVYLAGYISALPFNFGEKS